MHNQRGFIGIGVLIAILVGVSILGGGAYYLVEQQTSSQTASQNEQPLPTTNPQAQTQTTTKPPARTTPTQNSASQTTVVKKPSPTDITPTCTITANKAIFAHEEPMTFKWTINNAGMANLVIKTEAEDKEDSLTNVLFIPPS